ncbi:hypothetical protein [Persicitalea sp.]|uniref:alginate O-acetyltransferase AlgX-related protein n=1 Tax=Persicitalea sp. TaxID=3100273 RepID=UPI003592FE7A
MHKKILFTAIFLIFNLIIIELGLRLFNYIHPTSIFHREDYNQYRGKPNSDSYGYKLNSKGFKDVEYNKKKGEGAYRIVGIGDSFTFGVPPYPYNFLTLLEDTLNTVSSLPPVELINMGISSTGPPQYLSLITDEALDLEPDMVLLSFFVGNDIRESSRHSLKRRVYTYSYLTSALYYLYKASTGLSQNNMFTSYGEGSAYCDTCHAFKSSQYLDIETERSYIFQKNNPECQRNTEDALIYMKQIKSLCDRAGTKLVVTLVPDEMQINQALRQQIMTNAKISADKWDNLQPNRWVTRELIMEGIPVIDLFPAFASFPSDTALYKPNDSHWNIRGNQLAAHELAKSIPDLIEQE